MANRADKFAFLSMQAPASYVAGLGRGASGFTTRSDIGPARESGKMVEAVSDLPKEEEYDPDQFQDPENETGLFAGMVYEQDDEEADRIYDAVDREMDERRRARREAAEKAAHAAHLAANPKIQTQFADLKRQLSVVSDAEWQALPEVGNLTGKRRKKNMQNDRSYAVPDSVLIGARDKNQYETSLDEGQMEGGIVTPANSGTITNLVEIGQARDKVLSLKLDQLSGTVSAAGTSSTIDPKGYLTDLNSVVLKSDAEIGDIKKARALLDSVIRTNPKHAPGWIAAARVEEVAGRMVAARKIIAQGCDNCPRAEDVWLEAARLNVNADAKVILANAVQQLSTSVKIWLKAMELETVTKAKKRVLRKAIEYIPNSVKLWKEAVNLEDNPDDARILLARAVEVIPSSVELWLALARLETPENAKKVINKARKTIPTSHEIWIAAGRLQEQQGTPAADVDKLIAKGVHDLRAAGAILSREQWLKEAERVEAEGSPLTTGAIVKATVHQDVEEEDRFAVWTEDADACVERGSIETARAILAYALKVFPDRPRLWRKAADLEKSHGTADALQAILATAVRYCKRAEVLWLMSAKEYWRAGDVASARRVLGDAFAANPDSEMVWLAAVKLEAENGQIENARKLLNRAREQASTEGIWMKSAVFERQHGDPAEALETVTEALAKFPSFDKLHMIKGQILHARGDIPGAREAYAKGVKAAPHSVPLWILASRLEEEAKVTIKARALLEKARQLNPKNSELWAETVKVEERAGSQTQAKTMLARALQECPTSGLLWSMSIWMEPRPSRKTRSVDALKKSGDDPVIIVTVARLFWGERKLDKARQWFHRAAHANKDLGDSWAWWYKFECEAGTKEQQEAVVEQCVAAEPHHSPTWQAVSKDLKNQGKKIPEILKLVALELR